MSNNPYAIIIPTYNAGDLFVDVLDGLEKQSMAPAQVIVVDSGSSDRTVDLATERGLDVYCIPNEEFDHGGTRNYALTLLHAGIRYVVFLTQDAVLASPDSNINLLASFSCEKVVAAYGRQLPRHNAKPFEAHARHYNYPAVDRLQCVSIKGSKPSIKTIFISNSYAAYDVGLLKELGTFPSPAVMGEDSLLAAKAIQLGFGVFYNASACVFHSHDYTVGQEFKRYFDTGHMHALNSVVLSEFRRAEGEGYKFVLSEMKYMIGRQDIVRVLMLPLLVGARYLGYRCGHLAMQVPKRLRLRFGMNKAYWKRFG